MGRVSDPGVRRLRTARGKGTKMYEYLLAAHTFMASEIVNGRGVCLDAELKLRAPIRREVDFDILEVYGRNELSSVLIYVGGHPEIGEKYKKYKHEDYQKRLPRPINIQMNEEASYSILGVPDAKNAMEYPIYFHIFRGSKADIQWVAKRIHHCKRGEWKVG